jgi:serpin B
VELSLPRFHLRQHLDLKASLAAIGMKLPFDGGDFSGITDKEPLTITHVLHEAIIDVGEDGTVAAAVTAVPAAKLEDLPRWPIIRVNHPFVFCIVDQETHALLFVGRMMKPEAEDVLR